MRKFTLVLLVLVTLFSCKTNRESSAIGKKSTRQSEKKERQFRAVFLEANKQKMLGNNEKSITEFEKCKALRPKNAASLYELSKLYQLKGNLFLAIEEAKKAAEIKPENKWYLLQLARLQQKNKNHKEAIIAFEKYVEIDSKNMNVIIELLGSYEAENEIEKAGDALFLLEKVSGKSEEISYQKYLFYRQANKIEKAYKALDEVLEMNPESGTANLEYAKFYMFTGKKELVFDKLKYVISDINLPTDTKLGILMDYTKNAKLNPKLKIEAKELLEIMIKTHPEDVKSYVSFGDFYNSFNEPKKARDYYLKGTEFATNSFPLWTQILDIDSRMKNNQNLLDDTKKALESYPSQPVLYLYNGFAHNGLKDYKKAISSFKAGKNLVIDDENLLFDFYSNLGSAYNETKEFSKSDESFEKALKINSLQPYLLNNYSYFLSERNEKLDRAQEMSKQANELVPNNASFNDTYGWIFFQQGNYIESEIWIKKSLENGGDKSGTVLEHYGDVMSKQNKLDKAIEYWKKAKEMSGFSDKIDEKIRTKKYVE